ncbi:hypothetical protein K1719_025573 [Acacia pycnantha]|nr:hypothetical protein K1719_025573 [Acacia pycnantha]
MERLSSTNEKLMRSVCWGLVVLCTVVKPVSGTGGGACKFPAIFAFGTSNTETGNSAATELVFPQDPPYGETYFGRPSGRFADGRIILDFIAQSFGLPLVSGYLNSVGANFSHGANFASIGATITVPPQVGSFTLSVQYLQFIRFRSNAQFYREQGGIWASMVPKEEYYGEALYVFEFGQNDISGLLFANLTVEQVNSTIPDKINALAQNITTIYELGARNIWIFNTGPLGCYPYLLINFQNERDGAGCIIAFNELAQFTNSKLKEAVAKLRKDLPEAEITLIDIYTPKYDLISNAEKYGFKKPLEACCGYGGPPHNYDRDPSKNCGMRSVVNGTEVVVGACENPSVRVNWDGYHFTEAANRFLFNRISTGAFSDPRLPLSSACCRPSTSP